MDAHHHGAAPGLATPELAYRDDDDLLPLDTAATHVLVTPNSEKAPDAANVGGPVQTETQSPILKQPADDGKRFATLRAQAALAGHVPQWTSEGTYTVTRLGLNPELPTLREVGDILRRMGTES